MKTIYARFQIILFSLLCSTSFGYSQVFEEHLIADSLGWIQDITAFDLDLDGDMDILCSEWSHPLNEYRYKLLWWENTGEGEFNRHLIVEDFSITQGITPIDFDDDGDVDILLAGGEDYETFTILENIGDLEFELHIIDANFDDNFGFVFPCEIKVADLDGDDDQDIVVGFSYMAPDQFYYGGLKIYIQIEPYFFADSTLVEIGVNGWHSLSIIDFDHDDDLDIIANECGYSNPLRFGWWENNDGNFEYNILPFVGFGTVKMIDLNQDSLVDILRCGLAEDDWTNVFWLENISDLEFERHNMPENLQMIVRNAAVADYDLDGDLDLITSGSGLVLIENSGEEDFESRYIFEFDFSFLKVEAADFNDDERMDLVASTMYSNGDIMGDIYWFENRDEQAAPFDEDEIVPLEFELVSVHPNPFNSQTTVRYSIADAAEVLINVLDINGRQIKTLVNGFSDSGQYRVTFDASSFASGSYVIELIASDNRFTKRVELVK